MSIVLEPLSLGLILIGIGFAVLAVMQFRGKQRYYYLWQESQNRLSEELKRTAQQEERLGKGALQLEDLSAQNIILQRDKSNLQERLVELQKLVDKKSLEITELISDREDLSAQNATLQSHIQSFEIIRQNDQKRQELADQNLESRLRILGEQLLKERSEALGQWSAREFKNAVDPLEKELAEFRDYLMQSQKYHSEQTGALKTELLKLQEAQVTLSKQADELSCAIRGNGKTQGLWGEHQLEMCLEAAGLKEGEEYFREVSGNRALNETGRPDVIIKLPHNRCLIVDAKCSLTAYTLYAGSLNDEERSRCLKDHLNSLRRHVSELSQKRYDGYLSFNSPSFVFMFVPFDDALITAIKYDPVFYQDAMKKSVCVVSPSTLLPALKVVGNLWLLSTQNDRMAKLAKEAENLYKKAQSVKNAFLKVQSAYHSLGNYLNDFDRSFASGRGNLLSAMESFNQKTPQIEDEIKAKKTKSLSAQAPSKMPGIRQETSKSQEREEAPGFEAQDEPYDHAPSGSQDLPDSCDETLFFMQELGSRPSDGLSTSKPKSDDAPKSFDNAPLMSAQKPCNALAPCQFAGASNEETLKDDFDLLAKDKHDAKHFSNPDPAHALSQMTGQQGPTLLKFKSYQTASTMQGGHSFAQKEDASKATAPFAPRSHERVQIRGFDGPNPKSR